MSPCRPIPFSRRPSLGRPRKTRPVVALGCPGVPGTGVTLYLTVTIRLAPDPAGSGERGNGRHFWWALEPWVSPGLDGSPAAPSPPRSAAGPPVRVLVDMLRCRFGDSSLNHYGSGPTDPVPRPRDSWTCRQDYSSTCLHRSVRPLPALLDPLSRCGPLGPGATDAARAHRRGPRGGSGSGGEPGLLGRRSGSSRG